MNYFFCSWGCYDSIYCSDFMKDKKTGDKGILGKSLDCVVDTSKNFYDVGMSFLENTSFAAKVYLALGVLFIGYVTGLASIAWAQEEESETPPVFHNYDNELQVNL